MREHCTCTREEWSALACRNWSWSIDMASGVHSDKRSRVGDSPRFQWESVSRCCAELYVPRPKTRLRSGLARKHLSVSRQTSRAPVSAPLAGVLSYVHSGCPKLNRSLRGETRAVRSSGEIP